MVKKGPSDKKKIKKSLDKNAKSILDRGIVQAGLSLRTTQDIFVQYNHFICNKRTNISVQWKQLYYGSPQIRKIAQLVTNSCVLDLMRSLPSIKKEIAGVNKPQFVLSTGSKLLTLPRTFLFMFWPFHLLAKEAQVIEGSL